MAEAPNWVLFEHAVGYTLFKIKEFEDIGSMIPEVTEALTDAQRFQSIVQVHAFEPFKNTEAALENCNFVSEGQLHSDLVEFLEANLPKKKKKVRLGISDARLSATVTETIGCTVVFAGVVPEMLRGIRMHFAVLAKDLPHHSLGKAQLSLGHSYSRAKVKYDVNRDDNMVIQSIPLLDQLEKDINLFGMRIREWYGWHFPELTKLVTEPLAYARTVKAIGMKEKAAEAELAEFLPEELATRVKEEAELSMGTEITELDHMHIAMLCDQIIKLITFRTQLKDYLKNRMNALAPNLTVLLGELVGARLVARAGSLINLAKFPASTIQILGAEKALFRALKTRTNTPKHGLLFHSTAIGKASAKNKGRVSRFLANKCAIASRIDCFSDVPVSTFGEHLRKQVDDRLTFFETGVVPKKNIDVMHDAAEEAEPIIAKEIKKRKKAAKRARKEIEAAGDSMEVDA